MPHNEAARNMPMVSICHWLLKQYPEALDALLKDPPERSTLVQDAPPDHHEVLLSYFSPSGSNSRSCRCIWQRSYIECQ